jgi:hypothetical protein
MNPLKERTATTKAQAITTLFISSALLVGFMGMISMPQMIGSANAQSSQGSENACKALPGATLERGQCTAPAEESLICEEVAGQTPTPDASGQCTVTGSPSAIGPNDCPGDRSVNRGVATCKYAATVVFDCPGDIIPTSEGQCITKPGDRT